MTDLLPCPFCGCVPKLTIHHYHGEELSKKAEYDISCGTVGCYLEYGADWFCDQDEIVAMWNKRDGIEKELE